jgi:hypothetical protein
MLPATARHKGTSGHRASDRETRILALVSKDHCHAILKNPETLSSSRRIPCAADIFLPSVAAAGPIKSGHRLERANFKRFAQHVSAGPLTASIVVSQHCRF